MGPECGTTIVNGVGLGFANRVRRGHVGLVAASGTGLQEVASLIHGLGGGVSQAIGTGGRDLHDAVGGLATLQVLGWLGEDPETRVIALVSKAPSAAVARRVLEHARASGKPVVAYLPGWLGVPPAGVLSVTALEEAAVAAMRALGHVVPGFSRRERPPSARGRRPGRLLGLYTGGTLGEEARAIVGGDGHEVIDFGDSAYTHGRPHPIIDPSLRNARVAQAGDEADVRVLLLDVILGDGAHPDPAGALAAAVREARGRARRARRTLEVVAHVVGTDEDPQGLAEQEGKLREAGVHVCPTNRLAAELARDLAEGRDARGEPVKESHGRRRPPSSRSVGQGVQGTEGGGARSTEPGGAGSAEPAAARAAEGGLFGAELAVVSVGVGLFADALGARGVPLSRVDWRPPATGCDLSALWRDEVDVANGEALRRLRDARPVLVDVQPALAVVPGMTPTTVLHAGPPLPWARMSGPVRGAVVGALLYERLAETPAEAERLAGSGGLSFDPCHHHGAVGPMAGVTTARMPVFVVEDRATGRRSYSTLNEGLGKVLRYGAYAPEVLDRLSWMETVLGPALGVAVRQAGGVDVRTLVAQALQMGDECHNRNRAASALLIKTLAPHVAALDLAAAERARVLAFAGGNEHFFLNLGMAACKATLDAAHGVPGSSLVTAMARNGTEFGIRVSGLGDRWFTGPADLPIGLYFAGFGPEDANPDVGDSAITETAGLGAFAMAGAPAIVQFVGGTPADAIRHTRRMYEITLGESDVYRLPTLDFRGTPTGIDVRLVLQTGILPQINTGIAHRLAGIGQIGAGLVTPPLQCFEQAGQALAAELARARFP